MKSSIQILSINLKYFRYKSNLSQEKFAEAIDTNYHYVYEMELGKRNPSLKMLDKLAKNISNLLGCHISSSDLISYDEKKIINCKRIDSKK